MKDKQKYEINTEVKTLTGRTVKDGYVFSNTKGTVKSFNNKTNTYSVTVKYISGSTIDVDYKEEELILADLDTESTSKVVEESKKTIDRLNKHSKAVTIIGSAIVLALLVSAILVTIFDKDYTSMIITLIVMLVTVIAIGVVMLLIVTSNTKKCIPHSRKIENIILSEKEKELEQDKDNNIFADIQKLKALLDSGAITPKDYEEAKKELLKKLVNKDSIKWVFSFTIFEICQQN